MIDRAAPRPNLPRLAALLLTASLTLGGCTRSFEPEPVEPSAGYAEEPAPELLGEAPPSGPRPQDETGLLGGPPAPGAEGGAPASATMTFRRPEGVVVSTMQTVPDEAPAAEPAAPPVHKPRRVRRRAAHPVSQAAVTPVAPVSAETPISAETPESPGVDLAQAPAAPFTRALPLAPPADPKLAALQGALGEEMTAGARLSVEDAVNDGKPGAVRFSLPAALAARIKAEAAKLGLGAAARTSEVTARLSGEGYTIDPAGAQTVAVAEGEPIVFNWRVTPGQGAGPLKAEADLALTGDGKAQSLALSAVETTPPPADPVAAPKTGPTTAKWALAAILILLAALVLGGVWRNYKDRRRAEAERRERERAAKMFTPVAETAEGKTAAVESGKAEKAE